MTFQRQRTKKKEKMPPQLTFRDPKRSPDPGRHPLKKKYKRNINDVTKDKKKRKPTSRLAFHD